MLYPDTELQEWLNLYNLEPQSKQCPSCNKMIITTVPVALKGYRGLQSPVHECGDEGVVTILIPVDKSLKDKWEAVLFA